MLLKILKNLSKFFGFLKLTAKKIYEYKEIFFLVYVAMSISFEVISFLKISTFAAILKFTYNFCNFYLRHLKFKTRFELESNFKKGRKKNSLALF